MTLPGLRRQFAAGGHPADRGRRAAVGDPGDRVLREPALRGVQPPPAALPDAPAALAAPGARLLHGRPELRDVHPALPTPGRRRSRARRAGGLPGRQLLRHLGQLDVRQPGGHRAGQLRFPAPGAWVLPASWPAGHPVLAGQQPLRAVSALLAGAAAVAAFALPLKLNIVVAIARGGAGRFWLEKRVPPAPEGSAHERRRPTCWTLAVIVGPGAASPCSRAPSSSSRQTLDACPTGRSAGCSTRRWRRWRR